MAWRTTSPPIIVTSPSAASPPSEHGHDVGEGLHIDIYRDEQKYRAEYVAPPMEAGRALDRAEDHLSKKKPRRVPTEIRGMARDREPLNDEEIEKARAAIEELREDVRRDLAEDLGGDPEEYNADRVDEAVPDGGE